MNKEAIFGPVFAMMLLTLVVWFYMYVRRLHFMRTQKIKPRDHRGPGSLASISPPGVNYPSDNLKNLFEMPTIFYALCVVLFVTDAVDDTSVKLAWVFVALRVLHSLVHSTFNLVELRFAIYIFSSFALWFMVGRAMMGHFFLVL